MALTEERGTDEAVLGTAAARAVIWNYVSFAAGKLLVLVTMAILARLLTPEDFGVVGFATVAVAYLAVLKDLGLGGALIQRKEDIDESAETVFAFNLVTGVVLTALCFVGAPLVAGFFREPLVVPLLRVLSLTFVLEALGSVQLVLLRKNMDFKRKLIPDVGRSIVKGAVSIAAAAAGLGVWALVWGQLAGVVASVILAWTVFPWKPRVRVHRRLVRPLARFGGPLIVTDIQFAIWSNLDYLVVGRLLGDVALGIYTLAYRLPELLIQSVWRVLGGAIFPLFSKLQDQPALLRRGFLATIKYTQVLVVPMCVGLFITAEPAVRALFGEQWDQAIPVLQVMCVFSLLGSIGVNAGDVYKALGRPGILAKLAGLELLVLIPALMVGARFGIVGVAWAHAGVAALDTVVRLAVANRMVGTTFGDIWRQMAPAVGAGVWLAAAAAPAMWLASGAGAFASLSAAAIAGSIAYAVALWRYDSATVRRIAGWAGLGRKAETRR